MRPANCALARAKLALPMPSDGLVWAGRDATKGLLRLCGQQRDSLMFQAAVRRASGRDSCGGDGATA
jgi:hypothetical protein